MSKKFDTNPLDPTFPERARAAAAAETADQGRGNTAPPKTPFSTSEFPTQPGSVTEDETRRFDEARFNAYAFHGGPAPAVYQPPAMDEMNRAGDRKVAKVGVAEKWLIGLPYLPVWIGFVAGLVLLLIIPKEENKVRFHAAQGFAAQIAIMLVSALLGGIGNAFDSNFGSVIFGAISTVMMIVFAIKAWKGKPVHIEIIDDLTNWFEDKIGPLKS
ncbi:MAG: hypothetical protein AB7F88_07325 [Pyrinomonadaceae bacterium]